MDIALRRRILRFFAGERRAPAPFEVSATQDHFRELAHEHAVVLDGEGRIVLANPFSGVPTGYVAEAGGSSWDAPCAWDAFGVLAALGRDGAVRTRCSDCDEPLVVEVLRGSLVDTDAVAHFLVPAARWYDDLIHT